MSTQVFMHVDMDAFYASVEQHDNPELAGKAVVVGARPGHRGVVSACSYEARRFGVHSAMPISTAYRLCPHAAFLPVRMSRYAEVSREIMEMLSLFSPVVQQLSVDEAFLDITGTERLFGPPRSLGTQLKRHVHDRTGLTISVGIAGSRYLAKIASDWDKPDGLHQIAAGDEERFVLGLELRQLWGVGKKMLEQLTALGITTVAELRGFSQQELAQLIGTGAAAYLYSVCRGADPGIYSERAATRSVSGERTFEHDVASTAALNRALLEIAHTCMFRLIDAGWSSRTVTAKVRLDDFTTFTMRKTLPHPVSAAQELYGVAKELVRNKWDGTTPVRLIGCGLGNVETRDSGRQGELFAGVDERHHRVEKAVLRLKQEGLQVTKATLISKQPSNEKRRN
jgi:DNA polymerase IV